MVFLIALLCHALPLFWQTPPAARFHTDLLHAHRLLNNDDVAEAKALAQKLLAEQPDNPGALTLQAEVAFREGDVPAAEIGFKKALQRDGGFARAWVGLGRVFYSASFYKRAKSCFDKAHELNSNDPYVLSHWARGLSRMQEIAEYENFAKAAPDLDEEKLSSVRASMEVWKALGDQKLGVLTSNYERIEIPLVLLLHDAVRLRGFALPVRINGSKPLKLLLDTGASGILIRERAAAKLSLQRLTDFSFGGIGDEGRRSGYTALAQTVQVGAFQVAKSLVQVSDKRAFGDEDGLIGTDVFAQFLITLNYQRRMMILDPFPDGLPDDTKPHDRVIADRSFWPVFRVRHSLLIPTRVSDSRPVLFLLDTGSAQTLIARELASELVKMHNEQDITVRGASGKVKDLYTTEKLVLQFASFRQTNLDMLSFDFKNMSRGLGVEVSGILGLPVLSLFSLTLDYQNGLAKFVYVGPKVS